MRYVVMAEYRGVPAFQSSILPTEEARDIAAYLRDSGCKNVLLLPVQSE